MATYTKQMQILGLIGWLSVVFAASAIGAFASIQASEFYATLVQPGWAPPSGVFGPVWSLLYTLMGVSAWLVWREGGFGRNGRALGIFLAQLVANSLWSWLFFAWHLGALALVELVILWVLILLTLVLFWRIRILGGILLIPYLAWVSFAGALNYSLWQLNSSLL